MYLHIPVKVPCSYCFSAKMCRFIKREMINFTVNVGLEAELEAPQSSYLVFERLSVIILYSFLIHVHYQLRLDLLAHITV